MTIKDLIPAPFKKEKTLSRQTEFDPFYSIQRSMNQMFDSFFHGNSLLDTMKSFTQTFPAVDIQDKGKKLIIKAEMPGMDIKDVDMRIHQNVLTISGEKKQESEDKSDNYYHVERNYGKFHRELRLPCTVEEDKIKAVYKHGVLKIELPKCRLDAKEAKRIEVKIM